MQEMELVRSPDDRRRYELAGIGWLRSSSWLSNRAEAGTTAAAPQWAFEPRGWSGGKAEAIDLRSGMPMGGYRRTGAFSHRGEVSWGGRMFEVSKASSWRQRYRLADGAATLAELDVKGYGKRPARMRVEPGVVAAEPGLVLFTCWLCQLFVSQDTASTSAST
ncbi:MAG: hypothetical protein R2731_10375 [Nocardioides sp.]